MSWPRTGWPVITDQIVSDDVPVSPLRNHAIASPSCVGFGFGPMNILREPHDPHGNFPRATKMSVGTGAWHNTRSNPHFPQCTRMGSAPRPDGPNVKSTV